MKYFIECVDLNSLKKMYHKLAMKFHPDRGGSNEIMQAINLEYEECFQRLSDGGNNDDCHKSAEKAADFITIIDAVIRSIIKFKDLEIELCGSWLWVGGNTKEHKDALKAVGFRWSRNKEKWYWHSGKTMRRYGGNVSMAKIRKKYGSQKIEKENENYEFVK